MDMSKATRYLDLYEKKKALSAELKAVEEQEDYAEQELISELLNNGLDAIKCQGRSLSVNKGWHASMNGVDGIEAIMEEGMVELLSVQHRRLGSIVREHLEQFMEANPLGTIDQAMSKFYEAHPAMKDLIKVHEEVKLSTRKAG
jgi:hypothetical protein